MTTNPPTDAAQGLPCEDFPTCDHDACDFAASNNEIESLNAQLAAAQADTKVWKDNCNGLIALLGREQATTKAWEAYTSTLRMAANTGKEWPNIPQPVDASSLARIARVALDGGSYIKATNAEKQPGPNKFVEEDRFEDLHKSVDALTPDDIALAQAQVGGAR